MDLDTRITRRQRRRDDQRLVLDYQALNPVAHIDNPPGRGPLFERILDHLDPVFDGRPPGDAVLWGPPGSGKSAVVTLLFDRLEEHSPASRSVIHTSTRAQPQDPRSFVYLDGRRTGSDYQLYYHALDGLVAEDVPEHGISTEELRSRLEDRVAEHTTTVFAVDHLEEPRTMSIETVRDRLVGLGEGASLLAISRSPPEADWPDSVIELPAYGQQVLVDILTTRASTGLARDALSHDQAREIAAWAGGNAHDALAVLFGAADTAETAGRTHLTDADVDAGMEGVPRPTTSIGRVLTLPDNRQLVLRELLELPDRSRDSVSVASEAVADRPSVDLSPGTVRRFLYELAENGVVERIQRDQPDRHGRPPSRLEPRFPTLVFERLYDMNRS